MRKTIILLVSILPLYVLASTIKAYDSDALTSTLFSDIVRDSSGYLWIATEYGLNKFDGAVFTSYYSENGEEGELFSNRINNLRLRHDTLYILYYDAIQYYNPKKDNFVTVTSKDRDAVLAMRGPKEKRDYSEIERRIGKKVSALYEDKDGTLWVGCFQNTLYRITDEDEGARYIPMEDAYSNGKPLYNVLTAADGTIYLAQTTNGLRTLGKDGRLTSEVVLQGMTPSCMLCARDGSVYVGTTSQGLYRFRLQNGHLVSQRKINNVKGLVKTLAQAPDGTIYIGVMNYGVQRLQEGAETAEPNPLYQGGEVINRFTMDQQGRLWVARYSGIDCYDTRTHAFVYPIEAMQTHTFSLKIIVYDIYVSEQTNRIWLATNQGLVMMGDSVRYYTMRDGLPSNVICRILADNDGRLWMSTFHGLTCVSNPLSFTNYLKGNGLQVTDYIRSAGEKLPSGELMFGTNDGVVVIQPQLMKGKPFTRDIALSNLYVNNERVSVDGKEIRISYEDNMLTMQFSTMDMRDAENVCYEYRFPGSDYRRWRSTMPGENSLTFHHLGYGRHVLHVRAHEGNEYSAVQQYIIYVTPPFYLSGWAYICYLLLLCLGIAYAIYLYRHRQLRKLNDAKLQFYVDMAHEIRSPLTLIKSPVDKLLAGNEIREITRRELTIVQQNTKRLLDMASEILSLDKIQHGKKELHRINCNVADWLPTLVRAYQPIADDKHITLSVVGAEQAPVCAFSVSDIEKVINNFITNALKFTPDGGEITVGCDTVDNQLHIWVADTGKGINEAETKKLFELFYQSKSTASEHHKGFGVGLNLSYRIMQMHGGSIAAHNRTDKQGALFEIFLPLQTIEEPQPSQITNQKSPITNRKYTIFVVDDDESIRQYLTKELGEYYSVETYPDGEACWQQLLLHLPDMLISDVRMPKLDGFELLTRIRKNADTTALPVILLTTETESEARIQGLQAGADYYIDKPFNMQELMATIKTLLSNREKMRGKYSGQREGGGLVEQRTIANPDDQLMERVAKVVNNRLDDSELSVEVLAAEVGMSRAQLQRKLKELTGTSVGNYIREIRLKQAAEMLKQPNINVAQIGYTVGFTAPNIFSTAFKKYFGVTPVQYREMAMSDSQKTKSE